jgi:hypothetical protein
MICPMQGDIMLTPETAVELQRQAIAQGRLALWTVTWNASDYPKQAAARPHLVGAGKQSVVSAVLLADSLDELRNSLPPGLTRMERQPNDDPVIVEIWL